MDSPPIRLVVSDVDGTLVTTDKRLTPAAIAAVRSLKDAGVRVSLISARPPRGIAAVAKALEITEPMAAFNGGTLFAPDLSVIEAHHPAPDVARQAIAAIEAAGIEVWVYADGAWLLKDPAGAHVDHEHHTIGFGPKVVTDFEAVIARTDKIVGVSDDHARLGQLEAQLRYALEGRAQVERSQAYYLDVTHPEANKGDGVRALCRRMGVEPENTAVVGDMFNDVAMFKVAGFSVAMGQSPDEVKAAAKAVSPTGNDDDGFARAVSDVLLPRIRGGAA